MKRLCLLFLMGFLLANCQENLPDNLKLMGYFSKELRENSGLARVPGSDLTWVINDSGNKDHLYGIDSLGEVKREFNIKNAKNKDWEDLAADPSGKLYIADVGNNNFNREELQIYIIPNPADSKKDDLEAEKIVFKYPGHKKEQPYNTEAIVYFKGRLYLFTKNEHKGKDARSRVFSLPATPGNYTAVLEGDIPTCENGRSCRITAADVSPDGKTLALLSYDHLWLAPNFLGSGTTSTFQMISLGHRSQKEGLCFKDDGTLYLSDEKNPGGGGKLYRFNLD